jgi:hypothetical protein
MCEQYDNAILAALPDFVGQFGKEKLPKDIFEIKSILKQCVLDEIKKKPFESYETMIFDKKYFNTDYKVREIDSFLTSYTYEDTFLKKASRADTDLLQVNVDEPALETLIGLKNANEELVGEENILKQKLTTVNRANNPIYVFIHPKTIKNYEELLLECEKEPKSASVDPDEYLKLLLELIEGFEIAVDQKIHQIKMLLNFFNQKIKEKSNTNDLETIQKEPLLPPLPGKKTKKGQTVKAVNILVNLLNKKRETKRKLNDEFKNEILKNHQFVSNKYNASQDILKILLEIPYRQSSDFVSEANNKLYTLEADENLLKERAIILDLHLEYIANIRIITFLENAKKSTFETNTNDKLPYANMLIRLPNLITFDEAMRTHKRCDFSFVATSFDTFLKLLDIRIFTIPDLKC